MEKVIAILKYFSMISPYVFWRFVHTNNIYYSYGNYKSRFLVEFPLPCIQPFIIEKEY